VATKNQAKQLFAAFSQGKFFTRQFKEAFDQTHDLTIKRVSNFENIFQEYF
jgi:hypothetical protein